MTKEETVKTLNELKGIGTDYIKINEALDMAIKVLEKVRVVPYGQALQEAFDKDFKKEQLINRIEQVRDNDKNVGEYPYNRCIEIIKEVMGND